MRDVEFLVGDHVRIRDWDDMVAEFGLDFGDILCRYTFTNGMKELCGTEFVIAGFDSDGEVYGLECEYCISTDMIEHCDEGECLELDLKNLYGEFEMR